MKKIELHISDVAFKRLRSEAMVRQMANCGEVQDLMHAVCIRIANAQEGTPVLVRLKKEVEDEKTTEPA